MAYKREKAVLAAITAAVNSYLRLQHEAPARLAGTTEVVTTSVPMPTNVGVSSPYSLYGRQQMMDMRRLLSLRLARR